MTELETSVHDGVEELHEPRWNAAVEQSDLGSCFQRTEWLAVLEAGLDLEPRHVTVERDGALVAVCPNFVSEIRLPASVSVPGRRPLAEVVSTEPGFGGPIIVSEERDALRAVADAVAGIGGPGVVSHYLRTVDTGYLRYAQALDVLGYSPYVLNCRFVVDLSKDKAEIVDGMDKDRRYNLRKARENDASVREVDFDDEAVGTFYRRYEQVMERVGGDAYPQSFFRELATRFGDRVLVLAAEIEGENGGEGEGKGESKDVGQHLYLRDEERSSLHHLFSAVEEDHFRYYPSELIHDRALDLALEAGYDAYDFGETGAHFEDGLFRYKEQFGGRLVPTITWERGLSPLWPVYRRGRSAYRRWNSAYTDPKLAIGDLLSTRE